MNVLLWTCALALFGESDRVLGVEPARISLERALESLLGLQNEAGRFGKRTPDCVFEVGYGPESYPAWQMASQALACMALAAAPPDAKCEKALLAALDCLCTDPIPTRPSDWDVDHHWAELYGFVAVVELLRAPARWGAARCQRLQQRGLEFLERLARHEALGGGWAYYDDPPYGKRPTWATSFCTALVLPSLQEAQLELGWPVDPEQLARARRYVERCALPNGAYEYDLGAIARLSAVEHLNLPQGSLGRTQVCNWALASLGDRRRGADVLRAGLQTFFDEHAFLDHVRTRPIPHEGYHANAGYFYFFGHYYAACVIELLPASERAAWHAQLRPHLIKTFRKDGLTSDYLDSSSMLVSSTSFAILALAAGLDD